MAKPTTRIKIRYYLKAYNDGNERIKKQPRICQRCGYDSALDVIREFKYCPKCGGKILGIDGENK